MVDERLDEAGFLGGIVLGMEREREMRFFLCSDFLVN